MDVETRTPIPSAPAPPPAPARGDAAQAHEPTGASRPARFRLKAPLYDNSLSSGFFGDVTVQIERGHVWVTGQRSVAAGGGQLMGAGLVIGFFAASTLAGGLLGLAGLHVANASSMAASTATGVTLGALGLAFYLRGESIATKRGREETIGFPLDQARGRKARFDWNIGRGLAFVITPLVSLPIMVARGKRVVRLLVPVGPDGALRTLSLRACSAAEGEAVDRALRTGAG